MPSQIDSQKRKKSWNIANAKRERARINNSPKRNITRRPLNFAGNQRKLNLKYIIFIYLIELEKRKN